MKYTVKYKKWLFWHTIKNVKGDTILRDEAGTNAPFDIRVLFLEDKSRIEIPMKYIMKFSKERFYLIKDRMSEAAGKEISIKGEG